MKIGPYREHSVGLLIMAWPYALLGAAIFGFAFLQGVH